MIHIMSIIPKLNSMRTKALKGWVWRRHGHTLIQRENSVPIKIWKDGIVDIEPEAMDQVYNIAKMKEILHPQGLAIMPDLHLGKGACIGAVLASAKAVIPAAVGVDLGCGIMAVRLSIAANQLPDNLKPVRLAIEEAIPVGRTHHGSKEDRGSWWQGTPKNVSDRFEADLLKEFKVISSKNSRLSGGLERAYRQCGTLGTGNHYFEVNLDENDNVWLMLHSGSRGVGALIADYYIALAKTDMRKHVRNLPDQDLAYLTVGTQHFHDYVKAVFWAQKYAKINRELMMEAGINALRSVKEIPPFEVYKEHAVQCHHNYISLENHFGEELYITRKGAVRAAKGILGIIPGSMGANSFIVRGLGNPDSYETCSHGAGRRMSRTAAKKVFSVKDHTEATKNVECRKDAAVVDETPGAYKPIEAVIAAQKDLVEVVHTLRQIVCVKG